ncbi:unnamed protein product, partial [Cyprideis torosa]
MRREAASGKQGGRTVEIQRLIGRALRAGVDRVALGERQITVDCDVIQADGGTRCAAITGGWVALRLAVNRLIKAGDVTSDPLISEVAAVSCGLYAGQPVLDLDYAEDSEAGADGNFILRGDGQLIEVQMSAEGSTFSRDQMTTLLDLAEKGVGELVAAQRAALLVATHNQGKLDEIAALLKPYGVAVVGAKEMRLPEPEETGTTFVENARIKAHAAAQATGLPALSDDSGIEIDALDGQPGVYTADWAETDAGRDFVMAMEKSHDMLVKSGVDQPWTARFCCTLVLAWPDGHDEVFP